jgi:hypothetical protein
VGVAVRVGCFISGVTNVTLGLLTTGGIESSEERGADDAAAGAGLTG